MLKALLCISVVMLMLACASSGADEPLALSQKQLTNIGEKIYQNETGGNAKYLISWNNGEDFASLGIGHFIWFPPKLDSKFTESFPGLVEYLQSQNVALPAWLSRSTDAPWHNQQEFVNAKHSKQMQDLRALLEATFAQQVAFIYQRMQNALPKMQNALQNDEDLQQRINEQQLAKQFYALASTELGMYALIDYVNFKGEGSSPKERYQGKGWGLLQVIANMDKQSKSIHASFADSCKQVLARRVRLSTNQATEQKWLAGWHKRCQSYSD